MDASCSINISERLRQAAESAPRQRAVVVPASRDRGGRAAYTQLTFQGLDEESDRLARGLFEMGVRPKTRLVLMVRPGLEFIALTFACFKVGAVAVLIDPGMGRSNLIECLKQVEPEGFLAVPLVHAVRAFKRRDFPSARYNVTVGPRYIGKHPAYADLLGGRWQPFRMAETSGTDPAAIIFTSGSTGPPKGVVYEHGMFSAQVDLLRDFYAIEPGGVDVSAFPLFALFNAGMQVTTVIPEMNPSRPARVQPERILEAIRDNGATQAFGSPALWNRVSQHCLEHGLRLGGVKRVFSAGAPVALRLVERMAEILTEPDADMHTPYGATESLPVASISGREILDETAPLTRQGAGTCVGGPFPRVEVKIIRISDEPLRSIEEAGEVTQGEIGEIVVRGPSTTREYFRRPEATTRAKIPDPSGLWHRMGDVGYLDNGDALWVCGRKAHIVETTRGRMFTVPAEAIVNEHSSVFRSALVGVGHKGNQTPVFVVEPEMGRFPRTVSQRNALRRELRELTGSHPLTAEVETFLFHRSLPVDVRHNVKISREKLAEWAARQLS